nr:trypsin-like peptidase domain-containing protein [Candidatus Woesearchaeota archaeon]
MIKIKIRHLKIASAAIIIFILFLVSYRSDYDSFPKVAKEIEQATVLIEIKDVDGSLKEVTKNILEQGGYIDKEGYIGLGTGFVVDEKGYILTAKHNFEGISNSLGVSMDDFIFKFGFIKYGQEHIKIFRVDVADLERKDVQLLRINQEINYNLKALKIADKTEAKSGLSIGFLGYTQLENSKPLFLFVSKGIVSNINKEIETEGQTNSFYTLNGIATGGFSGGPVFLSKNGKVIALIKGTPSDSQGKKGIVIVPFVHEVPQIISDIEKRRYE